MITVHTILGVDLCRHVLSLRTATYNECMCWCNDQIGIQHHIKSLPTSNNKYIHDIRPYILQGPPETDSISFFGGRPPIIHHLINNN